MKNYYQDYFQLFQPYLFQLEKFQVKQLLKKENKLEYKKNIMKMENFKKKEDIKMMQKREYLKNILIMENFKKK